jgi:hypothetical protein
MAQHTNEKSNNPADVPEKIKVPLGDIGPALAKAASINGRTLSAEIRARLVASLEGDGQKSKTLRE